jgi:hypothetical protein
VQNTTHITQETNQNYGLFKSVLRKYLQQIINDLHADYRKRQREQQERQESMSETERRANPILLIEAPKLSRAVYGKILGGAPADEANGMREVPPIFAICFSINKNKSSWLKCGAVPLTRTPLDHRSVRQEIMASLIEEEHIVGEDQVLLEYRMGGFDWTSHTLETLEKLNHESCNWLQRKGYVGSSLKVKINRVQKNVRERISKDSTPEEKVRAMVEGGITLNSLFYTVGPQCLSSDKIFIAFEFRERLKIYEVKKKENKVTLKSIESQDKAKVLLALNKPT